MSKSKKINKIEKSYKKSQNEWKEKIRQEPQKGRRFWKWVWYFIAFPWVWIWFNIRDWRTLVIFIIIFILLSSEVWVPYLIGVICWSNEPLRISMFSVGSACFLFWLGPGTPFLVIVITVTIAVKALFNKISNKRKKTQ